MKSDMEHLHVVLGRLKEIGDQPGEVFVGQVAGAFPWP